VWDVIANLNTTDCHAQNPGYDQRGAQRHDSISGSNLGIATKKAQLRTAKTGKPKALAVGYACKMLDHR